MNRNSSQSNMKNNVYYGNMDLPPEQLGGDQFKGEVPSIDKIEPQDRIEDLKKLDGGKFCGCFTRVYERFLKLTENSLMHFMNSKNAYTQAQADISETKTKIQDANSRRLESAAFQSECKCKCHSVRA